MPGSILPFYCHSILVLLLLHFLVLPPFLYIYTARFNSGGYNPKGWVGYGEARGSLAAFLFRIGGPYLVSPEAPGTKLKKVGGASFAQVDEPEKGPSFGADSLVRLCIYCVELFLFLVCVDLRMMCVSLSVYLLSQSLSLC